MSGNIWEWCQDYYHSNYTEEAPTDGSAWESTDRPGRVVRGGGWISPAADCRSATRGVLEHYERRPRVGARIAWTP